MSLYTNIDCIVYFNILRLALRDFRFSQRCGWKPKASG